MSGHRRKRACELAGLETMPVIVRDLDRDTAIIFMVDSKRCCRCGALFRPRSNRGKYCPDCAAVVHRQQKAECERRRRANRGQLGA